MAYFSKLAYWDVLALYSSNIIIGLNDFPATLTSWSTQAYVQCTRTSWWSACWLGRSAWRWPLPSWRGYIPSLPKRRRPGSRGRTWPHPDPWNVALDCLRRKYQLEPPASSKQEDLNWCAGSQGGGFPAFCRGLQSIQVRAKTPHSPPRAVCSALLQQDTFSSWYSCSFKDGNSPLCSSAYDKREFCVFNALF